MLPQDSTTDPIAQLQEKIEQLQQQLATALQEKQDLANMLEMVTVHSDQILTEAQQEKTDLEILLETTTEHSSELENELQNQVEEERQQREEQFQLITAATPVGLMIARIDDGEILYANETMGKLLAIAPTDLLHRYTLDFYANPSDRQVVLDAIAQQQQFQDELLFKRNDGSTFWVLMSSRPFKFQGSQTFLIAVSDVSDRKQAEEALRQAEAKYRGIFENAVEGIFRTTLDGRYAEVNPAMSGLFGYVSPAEMIATIADISQQVYVEPMRYQEFVASLEADNEIKDFEYQVYHQNGSIFWVSQWARAVRDEQGQLLCYEGSCIDITKRKQEEEALKRQLRKLQIEIDQGKRAKAVAEIENTDYFQWLMSKAENLRNKDQ